MKTVHAAVLSALTVAAACAPAEVTGTLTVHTSAATPKDLTRAADLLSARVGEFLPSYRSKVTPYVDGQAIRVTFHGDAPPEEQIRYLATTRGELRIGPADEPSTVWVSDLDIEDATLLRTDGGPYLELRLNEQAGRTLSQATSKNVGRLLQVTWDGHPVLSAPILGEFGPTFVFNAPSVEEGLMMKVILKGGRLPVAVDGVDYRHGP